jgi:hypothetical protein
MSNSELSLGNAPANPADQRRRRDDLVLLVIVLMFVLCAPLLTYIGAYNRGTGSVVLVLSSVAAMLLMTGYVALLFVFRIVTFRLFRSPLLLVSVAILAGQLLIYRAVYHAIDLYRLFSNMSFYTAQVDVSNRSPRFVTFDWGSGGFAGNSSWRYLLFDETGHAASPPPGTISTADMFIPGPNCSMSISHLWRHFYSVAVSC